MSSQIQINIPKRGKICIAGQEVLSPGMEYFSLLIENKTDGIERQDFCAVCWNKSNVEQEKKTFQKHWKSKVPTKRQAIVPLNRDEQILSLLKSTLQGTNLKDLEMSFVLALYLARKRFMLLRKEIKQENKTVLQFYEIPETEEMILVQKIELSGLQIEQIQLQIAKNLKSNGN